VRHLGSVALAMLTAPLILLLTGRGLASFLDAAGAQPPDPLATATALAALGLAGMLFGLLTLPRLSPLGPAFAGVGYLGVGLWALADLNLLQAAVRAEMVGVDDRTVALTAAAAPLLAVPLLLTVFSAARWRGADHPAPALAGYGHQLPPAYGYPPPPPGYQYPPGPPGPGYPPPAEYGYPPPPAPPPPAPPPLAPPPPWHAPTRPIDATQEFPAVPAAGWLSGQSDETPTEPIGPATGPPTEPLDPAPPVPATPIAAAARQPESEPSPTPESPSPQPATGLEPTEPAPRDDELPTLRVSPGQESR
jgi:hypothetical protein